ncbi:DUF3332 domain-containing protein [Vibrio astriarenae]|jgi:hypothetical protein|uniref:DUF3332 domain-containing protein n=1 Tax=Vibrio agarivorans TaxID=153622 RepID=A0ABT7XZS3_9VIBR|nr:DUF3332 domain-containing protein [Vibrio agarivorans]MDN2481266.1 DUF3332 domain-containing protein [Vibrio agarivorans]MDN3663446.1 DUF3332 domain-containing protein [Vibrio agarivorans]
MKYKLLVAALGTLFLAGCAGQSIATKKTMELNMKPVDNRYARAGLTVLMSPIYVLAAGADFFVLNGIEFWTGTNPITGQPSIYDTSTDTWMDINDSLPEEVRDAALKEQAITIQ